MKLGIEARTGIKASLQRLVAAGRLLQEDALLDSLAGRIFLAQTTGAAAAESPVAPTAETSEIKLLIRAVWSDGRQEERTVDAPKQLPVSRFKEKARTAMPAAEWFLSAVVAQLQVLASLDKEFSEEGRDPSLGARDGRRKWTCAMPRRDFHFRETNPSHTLRSMSQVSDSPRHVSQMQWSNSCPGRCNFVFAGRLLDSEAGR